MSYTPSGTIYLCSTPIDANQKHQLYFANRTAQREYFIQSGVLKHTLTDYKYVPVTDNGLEGKLRLSGIADNYMDSNYLCFQNATLSSKFYYAFIKDIVFISAGVCEIHYTIDVYQTFFLDVTVKPSFVLREHISNDSIGNNVVDEGLDVGDYIYSNKISDISAAMFAYVVALSDTETGLLGNTYGNLYSGLAYYAFSNSSSGITAMNNFIQQKCNDGMADAIAAIFTVPADALPDDVQQGQQITASTAIQSWSFSYQAATTNMLGNYQPKNNKLFTYPYNFIYVSDNQGKCAIYRIEKFSNPIGPQSFQMYANLSISPKILCVPKNYNGVTENMEECLTLDGYPQCSWNTDVFANWFAQNAATGLINFASSAVMIGSSAVTGNTAGLYSGAMSAMNQLSSLGQIAMQPNQTKGNTANGSILLSKGDLCFTFYNKMVDYEHAKMIDHFFSMYGYKTCEVKIPNMTSRPQWNYVETRGFNCVGNVPSKYLNALKNIFDNGVTLWHNPNNFGNYNLDNSPQ